MEIRKENYGSRIASQIERRIRDGIYVAGNPLPGSRELAADFGVSRQVMQEALGLLQERKLLVSRPRVGVFVNPGVLPAGFRQVVVLRSGQRLNEPSYPEHNFLLSDDSLYPGVHVVNRNLPAPVVGGTAFWYEIDRIAELRPDCLLLHLADLKAPEIRRLRKLPFPVVFTGDFNEEKCNTLGCDMICESTVERAELLGDAAAKLGGRRCIMVAGLLQNWYARELRDSAMARARRRNLKLEYREFSDSAEQTREGIARLRGEFLKELTVSGELPEVLILDSYNYEWIFCEELTRLGIRPGHDLTVLVNQAPTPGTVWLQVDRRRLAAAAAAYLFRIMENPADHFGRVVLSGLLDARLLEIREIN